jgi:uncharacterized membrane protein
MNDDMNTMGQEPQGGAQEGSMAQTTAPAAEPAKDDISEQKLFAILGYILPFLFFLPLVMDSSKHSAFARFHANQQLILLLIIAGVYILSNFLMMILFVGLVFIMPLINLAILALAIIGIINAAKGEMKELPFVGHFKLIK